MDKVLNDSSDVRAICVLLDKLMAQIFLNYEEYIKLREDLDKHMKKGQFNVTKARISLGPTSITEGQYDMGTKATVVVECVCESKEIVFKRTEPLPLESFIDDIHEKPPSSNIRARKLQDSEKYQYKGPDKQDQTKHQKKEGMKPQKRKDPVQWFGFLPPATLRQAQSDYKNALGVVLQMANLEQKIFYLQEEYRDLVQQKKHLQEKSSQQTEGKDIQSTVAKDSENTEGKDIQSTVAKDVENTEGKDIQKTVEKDSKEHTVGKDTQNTVGIDSQNTEQKDSKNTEGKDVQNTVGKDNQNTEQKDIL